MCCLLATVCGVFDRNVPVVASLMYICFCFWRCPVVWFACWWGVLGIVCLGKHGLGVPSSGLFQTVLFVLCVPWISHRVNLGVGLFILMFYVFFYNFGETFCADFVS